MSKWKPDSVTVWLITEPEKITPAQFEALHECDPHAGGAPYERYKLRLYAGATRRKPWHIVERQYQFGQPVYFAAPITIVLPQEDQP
jgi:hypothetical protein